LAGEGTFFGNPADEPVSVPLLWPEFIPAHQLARGD
jgi:hypothetical protein